MIKHGLDMSNVFGEGSVKYNYIVNIDTYKGNVAKEDINHPMKGARSILKSKGHDLKLKFPWHQTNVVISLHFAVNLLCQYALKRSMVENNLDPTSS